MDNAGRALAGEIVDGRFRVEEELGSGGMGTVWRVEHVVSLQRFALKTLDPAVAGEDEATQRFLREARAAAALRSRHVVKIVDAQMQYRHRGVPLPFLVMELLEGKNLQAVLDARGRLEPGELLWVAQQLGRGLDAAHRQGIVHRDLKPSNVFIAEDEERQPIVKLCDFGIAKLIGGPGADGGATLATRTGSLLGTPMYLAPEVLRGASAAVPATDQWSLGLLAFRALAGWEYFAHVRGFPDLVLTIANDPLVPPSTRAQRLPRGFDAWFLRACARKPEDRFPDVPAQVAALAEALGQPAAVPIAVDGAPEAATALATGPTAPHTAQAATSSPGRRRAKTAPRAVYFASALVWAICALGMLSWLAGRGQRPPAVAAQTVLVPARVAPPPAAAPAPPPTMAAPAVPAPPPAAPAAPAAPAVPAQRARPPRHKPTALGGTAAPARPVGRGAPRGASCQRSSECASGLCAAESCQ